MDTKDCMDMIRTLETTDEIHRLGYLILKMKPSTRNKFQHKIYYEGDGSLWEVLINDNKARIRRRKTFYNNTKDKRRGYHIYWYIRNKAGTELKKYVFHTRENFFSINKRKLKKNIVSSLGNRDKAAMKTCSISLKKYK